MDSLGWKDNDGFTWLERLWIYLVGKLMMDLLGEKDNKGFTWLER